jgi:hypothetical protein
MRSWRVVPAFAVLLLCVAISGSSVGATSPTVVRSCGHTLCIGSKSWYFYGASVYNPGLTPIQSGIKDPDGTIQLAQQARLNTIRLINFYSDAGNSANAPLQPDGMEAGGCHDRSSPLGWDAYRLRTERLPQHPVE